MHKKEALQVLEFGPESLKCDFGYSLYVHTDVLELFHYANI